MTAPTPQQILNRDAEHVQRRGEKTHPKPVRVFQFLGFTISVEPPDEVLEAQRRRDGTWEVQQ